MTGDCGVCLCGESDGPADFWVVVYPKSRKEHKCTECGKVIPKGVIYQRVSYKFDGDISCCKTCSICAEIRAAFYCDTELIGEFWSQIEDYVFPDLTITCYDRLTTPEAKTELRRRWQEWKGLL